ncbi:UNVERIFIED_CONTAM: hypothetical protein HDU68_003731 [Siphonaria sp. JEL0065]|nr:hypothetical protein HDU68_003731 [Siphonaria sp. JEL0065]
MDSLLAMALLRVYSCLNEGCVDEKVRMKAADRKVKEWSMTCKMKEAQLILLVLLECIRVYRLHRAQVSLPCFPNLEEGEEESEEDSTDDTLASRYLKRKPSFARDSRKKKKANVSPSERAAEYRAAIVQLFDRIVIWDSFSKLWRMMRMRLLAFSFGISWFMWLRNGLLVFSHALFFHSF